MAVVAAEITTPKDIVYALVPAQPLPTVDLSKSLRGELVSAKLHAAIHRFLTKYHRPLLFGNMAALVINNAVTAVDARTGQILSVISLILWLLLGVGAPSTLRYDIVRLMVKTFDFWFFSCTTTITTLMISTYFWDFRFCRMIIDWIGFHNITFIDAQVRGIRAFTFVTMLGIPPVMLMLLWIMLDRMDGCTPFSVLSHTTKHGNFHLSGVDIIGNGLITLSLLILKIVMRKRRTFQRRHKSSLVECVIYRCGLKFEPIDGPNVELAPRSHSRNMSRTRSAIESTRTAPREPSLIQMMMFIKYPQTFSSSHIIFPLRTPVLVLVPLYAGGLFGLTTSFSVLANGFNGRSSDVLLSGAWIGLLCSILFVIPFAAQYERQLLRLIVTSFDFVFYAFQTTMANICVAKLYNWDRSRCLMLATWWIWAQWAFTLDALTPVSKEKLRFRAWFVAPVVSAFLIAHVAIICRLFFVGDEELQDAIIFQGTVWGRELVVRAMPFYFSRVVTLSLWCPRLIWRLGTASKNEVIILRGSVCFNNYFATRGRRRSRASTMKKPIGKNVRVEPDPAHEKAGPSIVAVLTPLSATVKQSCVYGFVPAKPLPEIDLAKSVRGQLLPAKLHESIHRLHERYYRPLFVAASTAFLLMSLVVIIDARIGQILSVISILLWAPLGLGAISTLRFDVVRLLAGTFDFWFFSFVTSATAVLVSAYFNDIRFLRMMVDWMAFHHIVCIDAHVRGVWHFALMTFLGILPVIVMLVWVTLDHVDGAVYFSLLDRKDHFKLSGIDVIGNCLLTQTFLITKIAIHKWKALRARKKSSTVQCVVYTCALKLVQVEVRVSSQGSKGRSGNSLRRRGGGAGKTVQRASSLTQKMTFVRCPLAFGARNTLIRLPVIESSSISKWFLMLLYAIGAFGIGLSFSILFDDTNSTNGNLKAWGSLLWTIVFVLPFAALCQRQLLVLLVGSFDFIFHVFQITTANICVCIMRKWELSCCLMMAAWEIWFLWALALDAVTPVIKERLRFRVRYAAPVVVLLLIGHIIISWRFFFTDEESLKDVILFQGSIWDRQLVVRAAPFYFSRVVTLLWWSPQLIWRFTTASNSEVAILRGALCYDNCFVKGGRNRSRGRAHKGSWETSVKHSIRGDQIAPAPSEDNVGQSFSALTAVN